MADADFPAWFAHQLRRRDWTQADFARQSKITPSLVHDWIRGKRRPNSNSCELISEALHIDLDEVLAAAGHRPRDPRARPTNARERVIERLRAVAWLDGREGVLKSLLSTWEEEDQRAAAKGKGKGRGS